MKCCDILFCFIYKQLLQEYLKQRDSLVVNKDEYNEKKETESQLHSEVRAMMTSLFNKLDALSNFHCTPRPVSIFRYIY